MGKDNDGDDRRRHERFESTLQVDYRSGDNFLFAYIQNISEVGIFIRSDDPLPVGTKIDLRFGRDDVDLDLDGEVMWVNPVHEEGENINPGMGVRFVDLSAEDREKVVEMVRTIAYLQSNGNDNDAN